MDETLPRDEHGMVVGDDIPARCLGCFATKLGNDYAEFPFDKDEGEAHRPLMGIAVDDETNRRGKVDYPYTASDTNALATTFTCEVEAAPEIDEATRQMLIGQHLEADDVDGAKEL